MRLNCAVDDMHRETAASRRSTMVFRARMDAAEWAVADMAGTLERALQVLADAETGVRRAGDIFRATAEGKAAE